MIKYTEKFNKHHYVLNINILMTNYLVDHQSYEILYNISLDNSHFDRHGLFPSYICTVVTRKGRAYFLSLLNREICYLVLITPLLSLLSG